MNVGTKMSTKTIMSEEFMREALIVSGKNSLLLTAIADVIVKE